MLVCVSDAEDSSHPRDLIPCKRLCANIVGLPDYRNHIVHRGRRERERQRESREHESIFENNKPQPIQMCSESTLYTSPDNGLTST